MAVSPTQKYNLLQSRHGITIIETLGIVLHHFDTSTSVIYFNELLTLEIATCLCVYTIVLTSVQ